MGYLIGDYIHAHISNYLYYGLAQTPVGDAYGQKKNGKYSLYNFEAAKNRILSNYAKKQNRNNIPLDQIKKIESFMSGTDSSKNVFLTPTLMKMLERNMNVASVALNEKADKMLSQYFKINEYGGLETFIKKGEKDIKLKKAILKNIFKKDLRSTKKHFETVKRAILQLKKQVIANKGVLTDEEIKYINGQLNKCKANINNYSKKTNKEGQMTGRRLIDFNDPTIKDDVEFLNLVTYLFANIPSSAIIGKTAEYGVALGAFSAFGQSTVLLEDEIDKILENKKFTQGNVTVYLVGENTSEREFKSKYFGNNLNIKELISQNDVSKVSVNKKGQGKTDIVVEINENGVKSLSRLSVKNYNLTNKHYVNVGDYSSLLLMLQQIGAYDGGDMVNHWLNVTSKHHDSIDSRRAGQDNRNFSDMSSDIYLNAHNAMKAVLVVLCAGGLSKEIDYLVVNNNHLIQGSNQVKVIPIHNLIDSLKKASLEDMQRLVSVKTGKDKLISISSDGKNLWSNPWSGREFERDRDEAKKRITMLLSELHSVKMKAALNPAFTLRLMGNDISGKEYYSKF